MRIAASLPDPALAPQNLVVLWMDPHSRVPGLASSNDAISPPTSTVHRASVSSSSSVKKRRISGSRGVANLSPDQLAKKRANDREAQRAIRERTKTQIETLERRIQELTSQQPYQDLQHVIRQKESVEAENDDIKRRMASILAIIQPLVNGQAIADLPQTPFREAAVSQATFNPQRDSQLEPNPMIMGSASQYPDASSLRSGTPTSSTFTASPQGPQQNSPIQPLSAYSPTANVFPPATPNGQQKSNITHGLDLPTSGERLSLGFLLDHRQGGSARQMDHIRIPPVLAYASLAGPASITHQNPKPANAFETPLVAHAVPVQNIGPTCPLDSLLLDFLAERRQRAAEGVSSQKLVGPAYPSVSSLLNPECSIYSHPLSKFFTDILITFPDLSALPEQVAVLYIMFLIMRWQISPTQEAYDRLPDWVTPRPSQLFTPHPAWVDHIPWPRMRDRMVQLYPTITLENFFIPYTTTLSLNWPYDPSETLLSLPDSEELSINPAFERHLRDLSNWSLGPAFAKAFPMLADTTKIKPEMGGAQVGP